MPKNIKDGTVNWDESGVEGYIRMKNMKKYIPTFSIKAEDVLLTIVGWTSEKPTIVKDYEGVTLHTNVFFETREADIGILMVTVLKCSDTI